MIGVALLLSGGSLRATPLNLTPQYPDIFASGLTVSFSTVGNVLSISGSAAWLMPHETDWTLDEPISNGQFSLTANLSSNGWLSGGSLKITGTTSTYSGDLLKGTLTGFGFADMADPSSSKWPQVLEFSYDVQQDSLLANLFGSRGGVIIGASGYGGEFSNAVPLKNFGSTTAVADAFKIQPVSVPEPGSTGILMLICCASLVGGRVVLLLRTRGFGFVPGQ